MKKDGYNLQTSIIIVLCVFIPMCLLFLFMASKIAAPGFADVAGVVARGNRTFVLRSRVVNGSFEEIDVQENGEIARVMIANDRIMARHDWHLSAIQQGALELLRTQWCQQGATFRQVTAGEPFYDVAIHCPGTARNPAFRIPMDLLPPPLTDLVNSQR